VIAIRRECCHSYQALASRQHRSIAASRYVLARFHNQDIVHHIGTGSSDIDAGFYHTLLLL
jgi:hypothetical protein